MILFFWFVNVYLILENHLLAVHDVDATLGHGLHAATHEIVDYDCLLTIEDCLLNTGGVVENTHAEADGVLLCTEALGN